MVVGQAGRTWRLGSSIISWVDMEPNGTEWTLFPERSNVFQWFLCSFEQDVKITLSATSYDWHYFQQLDKYINIIYIAHFGIRLSFSKCQIFFQPFLSWRIPPFQPCQLQKIALGDRESYYPSLFLPLPDTIIIIPEKIGLNWTPPKRKSHLNQPTARNFQGRKSWELSHIPYHPSRKHVWVDDFPKLPHLGSWELAGVGLSHIRRLKCGTLPCGGAGLRKRVQLLL